METRARSERPNRVPTSGFHPRDHSSNRSTGQVVTILARDRVGIIYDVASLAAERGINIERAQVTARGELISIEFVMDFGDVDVREQREELKAECLLPNMVGDLLKKGQLSVSVLHSADRWFGMTYHEDRQAVAQELARLHENGTYPATLRN